MSILYNAIRTPDGTVLVSHHRHDFVSHIDNVTGDFYAVDGGRDYIKRCFGNHADYNELSLTIDDDHSKIRDLVEWGTFDSQKKRVYKKIKELDDDHLVAIIDYLLTHGKTSPMISVMQNEIDYRKEHHEKAEQTDDQDRKTP